LLDVVVDVDVLSGTSAGGINAVMLGLARVRCGDIGGLRDMWLELGALLTLLREPKDSDVTSLLYGDRRMLKDLNEKLPALLGQTGVSRAPDAGLPSTTLYVTTTLLTGESSRFTDAMGTLVQDTDRHGVFTFTEEHLNTAGIESALALAARSTASFPGAFEPSFLPFTASVAQNGEVPQRPPMGKYTNITRDHWVADGGLLDNQPLDLILERIFDRRTRRPVRRVLLFVIPSAGAAPDLVAAAPTEKVDDPMTLMGGLLQDVSAAFGQSISSDLRAIVSHNDRMAARADLRLQLLEMAQRLKPGRLLTPSLMAAFVARESERRAQKLTAALLRLLSTWPPRADGDTTSLGIPTPWQEELETGGSAESDCRKAAGNRLQAWWAPDPADALPTTDTDFLQAGQPAFFNAKSLALDVLHHAYRAASTPASRSTVTSLISQLHGETGKRVRTDAAALALEACTDAVKGHAPDDVSPLTDVAVAMVDAWRGRRQSAPANGRLSAGCSPTSGICCAASPQVRPATKVWRAT
jgi:patatin-related protein